jgi:hypothetical protein
LCDGGLADCGAVRVDGGCLALRSRLAGGGSKPPRGALAEDRRPERRGKRRDWIASGVDRKDERWAQALCRLRCRKQFRWHQNRGPSLAPGSAWGLPAYCPGGVRHRGSMSSVRAVVRNMRRRFSILPPWAATGRTPSGRIREGQSTDAGSAGGLSRSSCEAPAYRSGGGAKGRGCPGEWMRSTEREEPHA